MLKKRKKIKKKEKNKLEDKWMIVKKEKMSTKIKNYFKNIFSKMFNNTKKNKKKKENNVKREYVPEARKIESQPKEFVVENKRNDNSTEKVLKGGNKEITVEFVGNKRKPKEITIEYENKGPKKKKELVVEYESKKRTNFVSQEAKNNVKVNNNSTNKARQNNECNNKNKKVQKNDFAKVPNNKNQKNDNIKRQNEAKNVQVKKEKNIAEVKKTIVENIRPEPKVQEKKVVTELALKPTKIKKEKKIFNIFQLFKEKERKKRKEILNRVRENKMDDYETISTKTKLSRGSIAVEDVDANELDPLIDLYRDSNKKLRNRIRESQNF